IEHSCSQTGLDEFSPAKGLSRAASRSRAQIWAIAHRLVDAAFHFEIVSVVLILRFAAITNTTFLANHLHSSRQKLNSNSKRRRRLGANEGKHKHLEGASPSGCGTSSFL